MATIMEERTRTMIETNLKKAYEEIGKIYYQKNKTNLDDNSYQHYFEEIEKLNMERDKLESRTLMLQGKKRCPHCQTIVPIESKFCNMCGEKLPEVKMPEEKKEIPDVRKCADCGTVLEADAMFCPNCGKKY